MSVQSSVRCLPAGKAGPQSAITSDAHRQHADVASCDASKVVLRERKSRFVEIFRTTPVRTVCPNFFVLSHANGCTFEPQCSYCYLKSSLWHLDAQHAFTNVQRMLEETRIWVQTDQLESYILNTGNLSDSLAFEQDRPLVAQLVELFRQEAEGKGRPHALLLVTKGGRRECQMLLDGQPCKNVIVSFSVNCPQAAEDFEKGAAPTAERLEAARQLVTAGWRLRIRMDPMIAGYDYAPTFEAVRQLAPERITLGCLRAEANLPRFVRKGMFDKLEFPDDPKAMARYPRPLRMELYRVAMRMLGNVCPVGLCEETPDVWEELGLDTEAKQCNCNR